MNRDQEANLPVLDFGRTTTDRFGLAGDLVDALHNVGFLVLENVPGADSAKLHGACEWLFNLSTESKIEIARKRWNPKNSNVYRGYFPADATNSSYKEAFEFGMELPEDDPDILAGNLLYGDPLWPKEDGKFPFKEFARDYFNKMQNTSVEIMRLIALGLGENEAIFDDMFTSKPLSTLRFLHYPPREGTFTLPKLKIDGFNSPVSPPPNLRNTPASLISFELKVCWKFKKQD